MYIAICVFGLGEERERSCVGGCVCAECTVGNGFCKFCLGCTPAQRRPKPKTQARHHFSVYVEVSVHGIFVHMYIIGILFILVCSYSIHEYNVDTCI